MSSSIDFDSPAGGNAWRRLSDPGLISIATVLVTTAIFAIEAFVAVLNNAYSAWAGVVYVLLTQLVLFGLLYLAKVIYLRRAFALRHPIVMVATVAFASFVSVSIGQAGLAVVQILNEEPLIIGLDAFISRILVVLVVGSIVVGLTNYRSAVGQLEIAQEQLLHTRAAGTEALAQQRADIFTQVESMVADTLQSVRADEPGQAGQALSAMAEDIVRPLSHDLATKPPSFNPAAVSEHTEHPWRSIWNEVTKAPWISPFWMALVVTIISIRFTVSAPPESLSADGELPTGVTVDVGSLIQSLSLLLGVFAVVWIVASVVQRLLRRVLPTLTMGRRLLVLAAGVLVIVLALQVVFATYYLLVEPTNTRASLAATLISSVPVVVIALIVGLIRIVGSNWRRTMHTLAERNADLAWEVAKIKDTLWQERRDLARALHGPLQSSIRAAARQLQDITPGDASRLQQVKTDVTLSIQTTLRQIIDPRAMSIDITEHCMSVQRTWNGLCDVRTEIDPASAHTLAHDHVCAAAVADIVTEAVANAAMHTRAREVAISMTVEQERYLVVRVDDDGEVSTETPEPGLGSKILDEVCLSWDLTLNEGGGASLRAVLPVQRVLVPA